MLPYPVRSTTAIVESSALIRSIRSRPFVSGILKSRRTRSGLIFPASSRVCFELPAACASQPRSRNALQSRSRKTASSSTTSTTGESLKGSLALDIVRYRKFHDGRATTTLRGVECQCPAQPLCKKIREKCAEPHSLPGCLRREERLGDAIDDFGSHAGALVLD